MEAGATEEETTVFRKQDDGQSPTHMTGLINVLSWNIEWLKSKLFSYDIIDTLQKCDVIGVQETWNCDSEYCTNFVLNYTFFHVKPNSHLQVEDQWVD